MGNVVIGYEEQGHNQWHTKEGENMIYERGVILKSTQRTDPAKLIVMVLESNAYRLISTESQFSAVVLKDSGDLYRAGDIFNNWNKGSWEIINDT